MPFNVVLLVLEPIVIVPVVKLEPIVMVDVADVPFHKFVEIPENVCNADHVCAIANFA